MKKIIFISIAIIIIVMGGLFFIFFPKENIKAPIINSGIEVFSPKANELISSPVTITGIVKGDGWTGFEGQVGIVKLQDSSGKELGMGILTATEDWMKLPTHFETTIFFDYPGDGIGQLVFRNENASGEPERDKTFTLPVKLQKSSAQNMKVKVYFNNSAANASCETVFYSERQIPKTEAPARAALEQLLMGPTNIERTAGFSTSINPGVKIQSLVIANGVAKVDFSQELQEGVAGSCRVIAIRSQIEQTIKQFSTVTSVVISINGQAEGILQP